MELYTKKQNWNKGKQEEIARSDNEKAIVEKSISKQKRKAPCLPTIHKSKQSFPDINGGNNLLQPYSSVPTPTGESWTSSSGTDYSPSSYTTSSTSGSVIIDDSSRNLSVRSVNDPIPPESACIKDKATVNGFSQHSFAADLNSACSTKSGFETSEGITKQLNTLQSEVNDCANISDYVENAILNSSCTNLSSSANKPGDNLEDIGLTHLPPRLTSFESSSTLNHDGLLKASSDAIAPPEGGIKSHYVSLDYVRSAAAEDRNRRKEEDANTNRSSSSSLSSSFISSVGSEDGSTIGSDVVEKLYNKITAATAHRNVKLFTEGQTSSSSAGEVAKDALPILSSGCSRGENRNNDKLTSSVNHVDYIRPPHNETTPTAIVDDFLQRNFNNNNRLGSDNKQTSGSNAQRNTEDESTHSIGLHVANLVGSIAIEKCQHCFGIISNAEQLDSDVMHKAKNFFGQCLCTAGEVPDVVTEIDFCNSNLKEVPEEIGDHAETLTELLLESNTIKQLPKELFVCQNLRYLSVSDNDIAVLPPNLASLINLIHLDVSKNVIEDVPECIRCCKSLQVLDASVNPIEKLSEGFTQLMSLRELYMNDCFFDFLPANFGRMSQLRVLELRDNQLQILPKSIRRLTQLTRLDLGGNVFQEWPDVISKLTNLSELWIDCNELAKVPSDIGDLTKLTYLDLSRNFLEAIPSQLGSLEHLTDLLLSENTLTSLPDSIGFLRQLTMVNLELNQIAKLPDSIGKLHALEELDVSHNKLEALPSSIGNLRNLNTLLLDENKLGSIPKELGFCSKMNILQLSRNQIKILPDSIGDLTNLKVLNICQNRIPYLPITMVKLTGLVALWVSPNQSKPNVPLHGEVHQNGRRILTNILFPQEEKDVSRARKVLGSVDIDDDDSFANDAADDDDLEAYAQRQRGKTHVVFDMEAITYSNDDQCEDFDQNNESEASMEHAPFDRSKKNQQSAIEKQTPDISTHAGLSAQMNIETSSSINQYGVDVSAKSQSSSLSVLVQPTTISTPLNFSNEKRVMKTAQLSTIKDQKSSVAKFSEESFVSSAPKKEETSHIPAHSPEEHMLNDQTKEIDGPFPVEETGLRTWSSHSNLPTALTEQTDEWNPDEDNINPAVSDVKPTFSAVVPPVIKPKPSLSSIPNCTKVTSGIAVPRTAVTCPPNNQLPESQKSVKVKVDMNTKNITNGADSENNLFHPVEPLREQSHHFTDIPQSYSAAKSSEYQKNVFVPMVLKTNSSSAMNGNGKLTFNNIPFMDGKDGWDEKNVISWNKRQLKDSVKKPETLSKPIVNSECAPKETSGKNKCTESHSAQKFERNTDSDVNKVNERKENESFCLSPELVIEGKSSSVTSSESISATDRDSGVGNDVESQESIPDVHDDHNSNENAASMGTSQTSTANGRSAGCNGASGIFRGKGSWLGLVETDEAVQNLKEKDMRNFSQISTEPTHLTNVSKPAFSKSTSQNPSSLKSRYASNVAMDSTTVTYSHDYNVSRVQNDKSISTENKNRRVADNIKKFEKFFENGLLTSESAEVKYKSLPAQYTNQDKSAYSDKNAAVMSDKPNRPTVSPVVPATKPKQIEKLRPHLTPESLDNVFVSNTVSPTENSGKSLKAFTRRKGDMYEPAEQHAVLKTKCQASQIHSEHVDIGPTKRLSAHMKKSKFEEALAATKHKHFRDKLEKMMQQKNTFNARLSRNSSSSVSSIPRITSPVPYHNPTPLDHMTADNTEEEAHIYQVPRCSKVNSIHSRLKEKLQPAGRPGQPPHLGNVHSQASADGSLHERSESAHQMGRHKSVQKHSMKNLSGVPANHSTRVPNDCAEESSKKSLEEQLGQLLLDGSSNLVRNNNKGFVPCVVVDSRRSLAHGKNQLPPTTETDRKHPQEYSAHSYNSRKHPMPDDWKQQLLQHIERKKQEKEQPVASYATGHKNVGETHRPNDFQTRTKSPHYLDAATAPSRPVFSDQYTKYTHTQPSENHRMNTPRDSNQEYATPRSLAAPKVAPKPLEKRKRQSLSKSEQQESDFTRGLSSAPSKQSGGRRSSGRFVRTRTPGPELAASESTRTELVARPKSAMDMPASSASIFDSSQPKQPDWKTGKQQNIPHVLVSPAAAPPSYTDHILRRATAVSNKQDYHDYVNVEYIDHVCSSKHGKRVEDPSHVTMYDGFPDQGGYYPLRSAGSHESVLNSKTEKQCLQEIPTATSKIRGSNSHDSVMDNVYQHAPRHQPPQAAYHSGAYRGHGPNVYEPTQHRREAASYATHVYPEHRSPYGEIPTPAKTNRKPTKVPSYETKARSKPDMKTYDNYYRQEPRKHQQYMYPPPTPMEFLNEYGEVRQDFPPPLHRAYGEREDESVASAFRPYHHNQSGNPQTHASNFHRSDYRFNPELHYKDSALFHQQHQNLIDYHRNHHHPDRGQPRSQEKAFKHHVDSSRYRPCDRYNNVYEKDDSGDSDPSLSDEPSRHWCETDAGVELVTVTVRKNPTFGFHIMGGIDAGGNPYRPDDDGVFITYVAPAGAADGHVQPGDKILLVNGSDFVGITHKRAVDLLRNAGHVAVLVVERLVGRPV